MNETAPLPPVDGSVGYRIVHTTTYDYEFPMSDGYTIAHLLPRPTPHQVVESAEVIVTPEPDERAEHFDAFGNRVLQVGVHRSHEALTLVATSEVVVAAEDVTGPGPPWETVADQIRELQGADALTVRPFAGSSSFVDMATHGAELRGLAGAAFPPGRPVVDGTRALCTLIHETFEYDPAFTDVSTPLSAVLEARRGVCQDFAHLATGCLRVIGLSARYVSGYVETDPATTRSAADASHAWCSVWVPEQGWIDFDPTNGHVPADHHITVAWGRDYGDVAPVRGVVIGPTSGQTLSVDVDVRRIGARPV
jgi:transglutaminase-like putative cysteine protease